MRCLSLKILQALLLPPSSLIMWLLLGDECFLEYPFKKKRWSQMKIQWEEKRIFSFLWTHAYRPFSQFTICGAHSFSCSVTRDCKSMKELV